MFIYNKYYSYYYSIINRAQTRSIAPDTYVERHHIIPKSLGGPNNKTNIVALTAREHLICHRLLVKITSGLAKRKMANAAWRMVFSCKKHQRHKVNSRVYESIRLEMAKANSQRNSGYKHSEESKKKISESKLGKTRVITPEWADKIRQSKIGKKKKPLSEETKQKISMAKTGNKLGPLSNEHRQKVADSKLGKKIQIDPVTGKRTYQTLL